MIRPNTRLWTGAAVLALSILAAGTLAAQPGAQQIDNDEKQEFGLSVGEVSGGNPNASTATVPASLAFNAGVAVEANYAHKVRDHKFGTVYWELEALGSPLRYVTGVPATASHEMHSVFVTPGVKLQFLPKDVWSPWIAGGGGYAFYDSSSQSIGGTVTGGGASSTGGTKSTYAVDFGGGVDFAAAKRLVLRGAIRGFYTGNPNFGVPTSGGLFNFVISAGIVWRSK
jgi:opacity protein-like surface antigen